MTRTTTLTALAWALALPLCTHAAAPNPCDTQANTLEINACGAQQLKEKDAALNQAYKALMAALQPDEPAQAAELAEIRKKVQAAQRAWIQYRDQDCDAMYDFNIRGSMRNSIALRCKIEKTVARTKELEGWVAF